MSKIKLHEAVQKEYGSSPFYTFAKDGPEHAPQFRAFVSFCGLTFQSPGFCRTMRQAENAAADVALVALGKPDDEPMQTDEPIQTNGPAGTVQIQSGEVHPNLQIEGKKDDTPRPQGNVPSSSESGITIALLTSEQKEQPVQIPQTHPQSFPSSRTHVVPLRELSTSEYSGRGINKQSRDNINSVSANSGNETNKEPGHDIAVGMLGKRQRTEVIIQPEERISTPLVLPDLQKTQLLHYAVKGGFDLPAYSCIREGLSHVPRFKARVKFDGQTFESSGYFNTVRQAEHAAASVALKALSERGLGLAESPLYKNYLQIKAQKEGRPLPVYCTTMSGQLHAPVFTSTLKFNGMEFKGKAAKTKKQAENNAASIALSALKELIGSAVSTLPVQDDKGKAPVCESNDHPLIQAINHLKEETTRVESNVFLNSYPKAKRVAFQRQVKKVIMEMECLQELIVSMSNCASKRVPQNVDRARVQQENVQIEIMDIGLGWDLPNANHPPTIGGGGWGNSDDRNPPHMGSQTNSYRNHHSPTRARTNQSRGRQQFRGRSRGRFEGRGSGRSGWVPPQDRVRVQQEENAHTGAVDNGSGWNLPGIGDPPATGWDGWGEPEDGYQHHVGRGPQNNPRRDHSSARARGSRSRSRPQFPSHSRGRSEWNPPSRNDKHFPMLELAISPVRARVQEGENGQNEGADAGFGWSLPDAIDPSVTGLGGWNNFDDKDPPPATGTVAPCA
ncbi:hypothetical protein KI387_025663 [Taxus chinensis]|uniref:DRBM domain-containing protein n=1 Tax=Taxus chinensis TaxID=29808 RepID=A0AA38FV62_TAXCH|nr:hypothetical protein KI387_025663 [Taxus chinensis]